MTIKSELLALKRQFGDLAQVEKIHAWAKSHPKSALHKAIEWNVTTAAKHWQCHQIRQLIAVNIRDARGNRQWVSLSIDRVNPGGGFRDVNDVIDTPRLREILLQDAFADFDRAKEKYDNLQELSGVWAAVSSARKVSHQESYTKDRQRDGQRPEGSPPN